MSTKKSAQKLVIFQAVIAGLWVMLLLVWRVKFAYAALVAGLICILANAIFARRLFSQSAAQNAKQIIWNFYTGEIIKLAIVVGLLIVAVKWMHVLVLPAIATYFVLQIAMLFAPMSALQAPREVLQ